MKKYLLLLLVITNVLFAQWFHTNLDSVAVNALVINADTIFAGTSLGLYRSSDNGINWTISNTGLPDVEILSLCIYPFGEGNTYLFAGTVDSGVYRSADNGSSWVKTYTGDIVGEVTSFTYSDTILYAGTDASDMVTTGTYGIIYRSTNGGIAWEKVREDEAIYTLAISGGNVFAGRGRTAPGGKGEVIRSTNNGESWTPLNTGFIIAYSIVVCGTKIFAGGPNGGVFYSVNNGDNWNAMNAGLKNKIINRLIVYDLNLFSGSLGGGVFLLTNNSDTWKDVNFGMTDTNIISFAVNRTTLFAGTKGGGVWRRELSEMITSVDNNIGGLPSIFELDQNYPNPFNPTTVITYQLPVISKATLKIYDVLGCEVATLVDEEQSAGWKEVEWNANGFASGIYFYKLQAGSNSDIKKMTLLK